MILKKISLNNIRSYGSQEITFNNRSVLLSGDIGSGKTSILLAIEFALFGLQPGQRGSSLLRNGEDSGGVSMEFEVEGKKVFIERTLKRGKTVSQDYAAITIDDVKEEIAVTELKSRVLDLLNYPKEFSKKQNLLYKFTVYTPQEEMKQIILQDAKTRVNTLRHIFGIDKYKKVIENTSILISKVKDEKKIKEGMTLTLDQDKLNIASKEEDLRSKDQNLSVIEGDVIIKNDEKRKAQEDLMEVSKQREEKLKLQQEIEKTKIMLSTKNSSLLENNKFMEQIKIQMHELQSISFDESRIQKLDQEVELIKSRKKESENKLLEISTEMSSLSLKNQENNAIKEKLKHIEVCPTCMQDVNETYKNNVLVKADFNTSENVKKIDDLTTQKIKISEEIRKIELQMALNEKEIRELNILKIKLQGIQEKQSRMDEIEKSNIFIKKDVELLTSQINLLKNSVLEMSKFDLLFEEKQKKLDESIKQEKIAEIKVAELKREIEVFSKQIDELKQRVLKTEEIKKDLNYLIDLEAWLSKQFVPMISSVEKNVMNKLKSEFSALFAEWFSMLVSDSFNVKLDDEFTPIIEHQDYVIDYAYLSGGERTAIALAYRLALNQVINSLLSNIKTKGLIILDEPTDGFSDQQLDKMRNVLEELNVKQLIIVSHEQKMEDFVDEVIKLKKENGKSLKVVE